jgi:hypothetical protein
LSKKIAKKSKEEDVDKINSREFTEILKHFRLEMGETTENNKQEIAVSEQDTEKLNKLLNTV